MELIYLWVEDYKNIYKQEFNFSPRFTCDYNADNNELTIDENDDYIDNFYEDLHKRPLSKLVRDISEELGLTCER